MPCEPEEVTDYLLLIDTKNEEEESFDSVMGRREDTVIEDELMEEENENL
jgi:hypothetical protein